MAKVLVVFMVGIIIPTAFLAYLGILSVREETRLLAAESEERVGKTLRAMQDQAVAILEASRKYVETVVPSNINPKRAGISFLIILDSEHHLVYPIREGPEQEERSLPFLQVRFHQSQLSAERAELKDHDYARAEEEYRALARQVPLPYWKAKFLLLAANCLVKQGAEDQAEALYQEILSRYSAEPDERGRPFGLLIALQIMDLQIQEDRRSLAIATALNVYQDMLNGHWKISWENEQYFARTLQDRLAELGGSMSAADHHQFSVLNSSWRFKESAATQARNFVASRWGEILSIVMRDQATTRPLLIFESPDINRGLWVIPTIDPLTGSRIGWVIAEISCREIWAQIGGTLDELAGASHAAYRLRLRETNILKSHQDPGNHYYPLSSYIPVTFPNVSLEVGQLTDMPVQRLASRRRRIYISVVILAVCVILVALYATWHAVTRELQLTELKSRFVASVSHELKTPLSIIGLIGQRLKLGSHRTKEQVGEYYGILAEETDRLKVLIDDVLDFSRLLENRQPYRMEPTDLSVLISESIDRCRRMHPEEHLDIAFQKSEDPFRVKMDREAIGRVILNLLDNAVKYSPADRIHITVSLKREDRDVVLSVADEGLGIAAEEQELIFERFYRGMSSMSHQKTNGVGLGLSIVEQIVKAHNGSISLKSTPGSGSVFSVRLPANGDSALG